MGVLLTVAPAIENAQKNWARPVGLAHRRSCMCSADDDLIRVSCKHSGEMTVGWQLKDKSVSLPVVGMPGQHLLYPVNLLSQHGSCHKVRPRHATQGKTPIGLGTEGSVEAIGTANEEGNFRYRILLPILHPACEGCGRRYLTVSIQDHGHATFCPCSQESLCLG